ncbi:MAG: TauD/TfdA dioxygenase family protein [Rhodospirillales bacterium]|jgi:taurine dioxygenase
MAIAIRPLGEHVGAEATGVDVRTIGPAETERLLDALTRHGVLVLRDQTMTPDDLVAFGRRFGPVEYGVREDYQLPENKDVYVISNIVENGRPLGNPNDGFAWHTDLSFLEHPTAYTFLYAIECPPEGAQTEFASAFRTYDALDAQERARLDAMRVLHSYDMLHKTRKWAAPLSEDQKAKFPDVVHPMVRTHPVTGRKSVYLGPNTSLPIGMGEAEGAALIAELMDRTTDPRHVHAHDWRPGDLVVWDNRGMVHRATEYDKARYRRLMHRVTVRGERPF